MEHYKHYNTSKKRKDKFKNLTMSLKSGLLIIILSILMTRIKVTSGKKYDWKHTNRYDVFAFPPQARHSNNFKKYKENPFFPSRHFKKQHQIRFPSLDQISNRLDNKIETRMENLESTTSNPYDDDWESITPNATSPYEKYSYKVDNEPVTVKSGDKLRHSKYRFLKDDLNGFGTDFDVEFGSDKKGIVHFTTSKPWDHEQQDVAFHGMASSKETNNNLPAYSSVTVKSYVPVPSREELLAQAPAHSRFSATSQSRHLAKELIEERKKKANQKKKNWNSNDEVNNHIERLKEWRCQLPKARIIKVQEVHPDPSKQYLPSCAILHRCSNDTGCCENPRHDCKPKNTTKVELSFYIIDHSKNSVRTVEKREFENHTECSCQSKTEVIIPEQRDSESSFSPRYIRATTEGPISKTNCRCPSEYSARNLSNGTCICDCFDKQTDCLSLKKGKQYFLPVDRICIQESTCLPPSCEYGSYIREYGRCPKARERHYGSFRRHIT